MEILPKMHCVFGNIFLWGVHERQGDKPSGEKGEKPEMKFSSETTSIDLSSVKIYKMGENHQKTECTYSDISADDMVTIVYAEDNTTVSEIIINKAPKTEKTSTTEA